MTIFKRFIIISVYAHIIINNSNSQEIITQEHSQYIFYGSENFREIGDLDGDGGFTHNGIENAGAVYLYLGETVSKVGIAPLLR